MHVQLAVVVDSDVSEANHCAQGLSAVFGIQTVALEEIEAPGILWAIQGAKGTNEGEVIAPCKRFEIQRMESCLVKSSIRFAGSRRRLVDAPQATLDNLGFCQNESSA